MKKKHIAYIILVCFIIIYCFWVDDACCQTSFPEPVKVINEAGESLDFAWAGGMNSCQFGSIDMNFDGTKDLFVFDRNGNRILTFINNGNPGTDCYDYDPEYASLFPELVEWAILIDYNHDGLEDIFTYSPGYAAMRVYKNISVNSLAFELEVTPYLTSFQGGMHTNILVTYVDYPGIVDLDGDGDLDILTFWGLGSFVELHKNLSIEKYGNADSLDYEKTESCWGYFAESEESNIITLDTCFGWEHNRSDFTSRLPHTGSTFFMLDTDADQVFELALGDVDYPNVIFLKNGGTPDSAYMISQDPEFPATSLPIRLFSMPVLAYLDIGSSEMPQFERVHHDFALLSEKGLVGIHPAFADLDGDQDADMLVGNEHGTLLFYENTAGPGQSMNMVFRQSEFQQIDVGKFSTPQLVDLDRDELTDLVVGEEGGTIYFYKNYGTQQSPDFQFITDSLGKIDVTDPSLSLYGYSVPTFFKTAGGSFRLLVGSEQGKVFYYENIDGNLAGEFTESDSLFLNIGFEAIDPDRGMRTAAAITDFNNDGHFEMIVGNYSGGLEYFSKNSKPAVSLEIESPEMVNSPVKIIPNPAKDHFVIQFYNDIKDHTVQIILMDLSGRELKKWTIFARSMHRFNIHDVDSGVYILKGNYVDVNGLISYFCTKIVISK